MKRMFGLFGRLSEKSGLPPGTPVHVGEKKAEKVNISVLDYDGRECVAAGVSGAEECLRYRGKDTVTWINVAGLHEAGLIEELCRGFGLHPLVIEDILNTEHRPKLELLDDYLFLVIKTHKLDSGEDRLETEQVSIVLAGNVVITFQEREADIFEPVRKMIRNNVGRIRRSGADYLAYALMDAAVDNYFVVLERLGELLEDLDEKLLSDPGPEALHELRSLKTQITFLRKSVWPLREVINVIQRGELPMITEPTRIYLRDLYDHTIQVIDTVETYRDMVSGMFDLYLSSVSNRMNEVMKVLTVFASIFIPLTFIAGVYGMNFQYMPELEWRWGYFAVLLLMLGAGLSMLVYFWRRKWL